MKAKDLFKFECIFHISMEKEKHFVQVHLCRKLSHSSYPAGNGSYCNHIMTTFFVISDYSLNALIFFPLELICTSKIRQWIIAGKKYCSKAPVMETIKQNEWFDQWQKCSRTTVLIKSPRAKRNFDLLVLLQNSIFCVEKLDTDLLYLKQAHSDGYYEEIQMCIG